MSFGPDEYYLTTHRQGVLEGHRHRTAYVAVVLVGEYLESSVDGVFRCRPGMAISHPRYHWHYDIFHQGGAIVLNMPGCSGPDYQACTLPANILRRPTRSALWEKIRAIAPSDTARIEAVPQPPVVDRMARRLAEDPSLKISDLAGELALSCEYVSRLFRRFTGLTPGFFRSELRARQAIAAIQKGEQLSQIAAQVGYSDQSHMGRDLRRITGRSPASLRASGQLLVRSGFF